MFKYSRKAPVTFHASVCLSVCLSFFSVSFVGMYHCSCHRISMKLQYWGNSVKRTKCWLKWGKNIGHFAWRPKYVLLFLATLNHHKSTLWLKWCQAVMASICQHVSVPLSLHRLTWNFMLVTSVKLCVGKFQICLKSGTSAWRPKYVLCFWRHYIAIEALCSSEMILGC
jgi:hypothetical protein